MPHSDEYLEYVLEQLSALGGLVPRRMFGGAGIYQDELFFGLIFKDTLYFKVNDDNRASYEARGMARFRPYENRPQVSLTYYEVPVDVLENREELALWARQAVEAAAASKLEKETKQSNAPKRKRAKAQSPKLKRAALERPKRKRTPP
jgi:DNA transformation protein